RIRRGGDHHESSRQLADFSSEDGSRVSFHDDGGAPSRSFRLHQTRHITKHTAVITAHVRIEGIVDVRERIRTKGVVDGHLANPEIVAGQSHVDAEQLFHKRLHSPNETLCPAAGEMGETTPILGVCAYSKE